MSTSGGPGSSAGGNQHLGNGGGGQQGSSIDAVTRERDVVKDMVDLYKIRRKLDGDYLDNLKDSVKEMQKSLRVYDQINAKIDAYSATEINTKKVKQEIFKNDVNRNINLIKLNSLSKQLSNTEKQAALDYLAAVHEKQKAEDALRDTVKSGGNVAAARETVVNAEKLIDARLEGLNVEQASYAQALKSDELYKKSSERLAERIVFEKKSEKHLGVLGHLLQITATKAGLGNDVFEQMVAKSKQLILQQEEEQKLAQERVNEYTKAYNKQKDLSSWLKKELASASGESAKGISDEMKRLSDELKEVQKKNLIGWAATGAAAKAAVKGIGNSIASPFIKGYEAWKNFKKNAPKAIADVFNLIKRGPNWGAMMSGGLSSMKIGWKVLGAGVSGFFSSVKEKMKTDPLLKYGLVVGGIAYAFKALGKAGDFVGNNFAKAGNAVAGFSEDSGNNVRNLTSGVSSLLRNIPLVGGLLGGLVDGFSAIADLLIGVDNMIVKAGRSLNMSNGEVRSLNASYQDLSAISGNVYMTSRDYLQTLVSISDVLGTTNVLSKSSLETSYMLNKYAGLEFDTLAEIERVSKVNGKTQEGLVTSVLAQVQGLEKATGIQFNHQKILKELAGSTGYIGLQFTKYPEKLTKSVLTVKSLGLELKDLEGIADSMLDFESSLSKEFEAQLITGKNINLSKVRQLALDNDLAGMALEINNQIGSSEEFMNMNRIAQEAYAGAVGMSRDSLADMLRKQEYLAKLGAKDTDNAREQLRLGLQKYKSEKELAAVLGQQAYDDLVRASTQERLMEYIEKIKQSVVDFLDRSGIIGKIENFVKMITDPKNVNGIINTIKVAVADFIKFVSFVLADIVEVGGSIANFFTFGERGDQLEAGANRTAAKMREFGLQSQQSVLSVGGQLAENAAATGNGTASSSKQDPNNVTVVNQNNIEPVFDGEKWVLKVVTTSQTIKSDGSRMNSVKKQ